jgi:hypothetical protein
MNPLSEPTQATKTRPTRSVPTKRYEPVALTFRKNGFTNRQIAREGAVCIYEQRWGNSENVAYHLLFPIKELDRFLNQ